MASRSEEERISRWLEEEDSDPSDIAESDPEDRLLEEEWLEESQHDTDTEQEGNSTESDLERGMITTHESDLDSDDIPLSSLRDQYYTSKNGTKWRKTPYPVTRTRTCNILTERAGPKDAAKNAKSELECFGLYFDQSIIEILVNSTNIYIEHVKSKFYRDRDAKLTDILEIKAFLGMLFVMGVHKSGRRNLEDFWNTNRGTGTELIYLVMSLKRFRFLLRTIRFDNIRDRDYRRDWKYAENTNENWILQ
ncbi:unnamed protein product [Parnassius apollo]|uniref:(apollo) hypothetical protein n=1 Tax=Parnassius apollo TaxID=110799 RepID=A0A8S3XCA6_PARAO|nr:unnamed protein product [Parnassius apollo]